jgi:hypothetical protein
LAVVEVEVVHLVAHVVVAVVELVVLLQYNLYQCVEQQVIPYQLVAVEL